jgi:hypothetical protein
MSLKDCNRPKGKDKGQKGKVISITHALRGLHHPALPTCARLLGRGPALAPPPAHPGARARTVARLPVCLPACPPLGTVPLFPARTGNPETGLPPLTINGSHGHHLKFWI